jgi:hypothetical protein
MLYPLALPRDLLQLEAAVELFLVVFAKTAASFRSTLTLANIIGKSHDVFQYSDVTITSGSYFGFAVCCDKLNSFAGLVSKKRNLCQCKI